MAAKEAIQKHRVGGFPDPVTNSEVLHCVRHFLETTTPLALKMLVCAVSGEQKHNAHFCFMRLDTFAGIKQRDGSHVLIERGLPIVQGHADPRNKSMHLVELDHIVLADEGIAHDECGEVELNICKECHRALVVDELPACTLANDLWMGNAPAQFADMTIPEQLLCSIARIRVHMFKLRSIGGEAQRAYRGNCIAFPQEVPCFDFLLPCPVVTLAEMLKVVFVGIQRTSREKMVKIFNVRRLKDAGFLMWLKAVNPVYKNVILSSENIATLLANKDTFSSVNLIPDVLWNTIATVAEAAERDGYTPQVEDDGNAMILL